MSHKASRVAAGLVLASALGICAAAVATRTASADIISTVGLTAVTAPSIVTGDFIINSGGALPTQLIFPEKQGFTLLNPLVTDTGTIAAGTIINSYFFALNSSVETFVNTSVTFSDPVLGIIYKDGLDPYGPNPGPFNPNFALSNFLGAVGTTYSLDGPSCGTFCGFEVIPSPDMDTASFAGNTTFFHNDYSSSGDFARIIDRGTRADRPEGADSRPRNEATLVHTKIFTYDHIQGRPIGDRGPQETLPAQEPFICQMPRREAARSRQSAAVCRQRLREPAAAKL